MAPYSGVDGVPAWQLAPGVTIIMTVAVAPVFLTGAAAVFIQPELGFGRAALGAAVAIFFGVMSAVSMIGGRASERFGPRRVLVVCGTTSAVCLMGSASTSQSWWTLTAWMVAAGITCGFTLPAASHALTAGIPTRQGLLFGLKQSAPPLASLLAGLSVPLVGATVGWRWAYVGVAGVALLGVLLLPRGFGGPPDPHRRPVAPLPTGALVAVSVASGLGSTSALAMGAFFVLSAVDGGMSASEAGALLALGSLVGVGARLYLGWRADRQEGGHLQRIVLMLAVATTGYLLLGLQGGLVPTAVGVVISFGFGYGWSGLLFHAIAKACPQAPASAIGLVNTGATAGAAIGPAVFGLVADQASFTAAWVMAAGAAAASALMLQPAARRLDRHGPAVHAS